MPKPSWVSPRYRLQPAALLLSLVWVIERHSPSSALSWKCYGLRETLMERSCLFCRRFGRDLEPLLHGDACHASCRALHRDEWARLTYPSLYFEPA